MQSSGYRRPEGRKNIICLQMIRTACCNGMLTISSNAFVCARHQVLFYSWTKCNMFTVQWTAPVPEPQMTMIILNIFPKVENWMFMFSFDRISTTCGMRWVVDSAVKEMQRSFFTRQFSSHFVYGRRKRKIPIPLSSSLTYEWEISIISISFCLQAKYVIHQRLHDSTKMCFCSKMAVILVRSHCIENFWTK